MNKNCGKWIENRFNRKYFVLCSHSKEIAKKLIDIGADVNTKADGDRTLLHMAAEYAHEEMATILIEHGADVDAKDVYGFTPLHICANNGKFLLNYQSCRPIKDQIISNRTK